MLKKLILSFLFSIIFIGLIHSQQKNSFYGEVFDSDDKSAVIGAVVSISGLKLYMQTDGNGHFHFNNLKGNQITLHIEALGYKTFSKVYQLNKENHAIVYLERADYNLGEITILNHKSIESTQSNEIVGKSYIFENNSTNLVKTLSKIPGVESMNIGAGFSKPMIRGFGFNRVAVIDKGISQQDQQWGADHGLEIDQFDVDDVVVHKGPKSLAFGADAIGGAIEILPHKVPNENIYMGDITFIGKSNNNLTGLSASNAVKHNKWFFKGRYTLQRYSDYKVPAKEFIYLNTILPILDKKLKNTAGKEQNLSGSLSFTDSKLENTITVSNVNQKNGFFLGAHGIPNKDNLLKKESSRKIGMPYSSANHFKVIDNISLKLNPDLEWKTDIGYQYNHRKEYSYFHTHFVNQTPPEKDPNLEFDFRLHTYTLNSQIQIVNSDKFIYTFGLQSLYQENKIEGYGFFLPQYYQTSLGGYGILDYHINDKLSLIGGIRYDYGNINIQGYYDDIIANYAKQLGLNQLEIDRYAQSAKANNPHFNNVSGSVGAIYNYDKEQTWKINVGKSFRLPTANELASNGIHHGSFRYEEGNPKLKAEEGYQLDVDYTINKGIFTISLSPYMSYFSNYIYLNPAGIFSILPDAGQIYKYEEGRAFFAGGEYQVRVALFHHFDFYTSAQYVYNRNETTKYPLPFTPPFSMRNEITYSNKFKNIQSYKLSIEHQLYAKQDRIARGEDETEGKNIFNFTANSNFKFNNFRFSLNLQIQNIFDSKYMNHLSYYRQLNIPEPGRNIQILLKIPFYNQ